MCRKTWTFTFSNTFASDFWFCQNSQSESLVQKKNTQNNGKNILCFERTMAAIWLRWNGWRIFPSGASHTKFKCIDTSIIMYRLRVGISISCNFTPVRVGPAPRTWLHVTATETYSKHYVHNLIHRKGYVTRGKQHPTFVTIPDSSPFGTRKICRRRLCGPALHQTRTTGMWNERRREQEKLNLLFQHSGGTQNIRITNNGMAENWDLKREMRRKVFFPSTKLRARVTFFSAFYCRFVGVHWYSTFFFILSSTKILNRMKTVSFILFRYKHHNGTVWRRNAGTLNLGCESDYHERATKIWCKCDEDENLVKRTDGFRLFFVYFFFGNFFCKRFRFLSSFLWGLKHGICILSLVLLPTSHVVRDRFY